MKKVTKFLTSIAEEVKVNARTKVLKSTMDRAIAIAEEEITTIQCEIDLYQMEGDALPALNGYMGLKMKLKKAQADLEFKQEIRNELFEDVEE